MLCSHCSAIFDGSRQFQDELEDERFQHTRYQHHTTLSDLLESVRKGCHICVWIKNGLGDHGEFSTSGQPIVYAIQREDRWGTKPPGALDAFTVTFYLERLFRFYMYRAGSNTLSEPGQPDESPENENTASDPAWKIATHWLEDCVINHRTCNGTSSPGFLPTRAINVGDALDQTIRLHEFGSCDESQLLERPTLYMTLSHSWGKKAFQTLVSSNLEEFKKCIPVECLTKTFVDAIAITRRCNIQFLWIDSLCVLQDSVEDWEKESAMMADVYSNTYLNIAATSARDGDGGCFSERNPLTVSPYTTKNHSQLIEDSNYLPPGQYICSNSLAWQMSVEDTALGSRAWIIQERFLAPRTLHFGSDQLYWECCEKHASESQPDWSQQNFTSQLKSHESLEVGLWLHDALPLGPEDTFAIRKERRKIYNLWELIVHRYTSCSLTVDTDKLVAFSAVSRLFQRRLGDQYVAGMWRKDLIYQLLWMCFEPLPRSLHYCAPTWSWASTRSPVLNSCNVSTQDVGNTLATVEDLKMVFCSDNIFGALKSSALYILGHLVEGTLFSDGQPWRHKITVDGLKESVICHIDIPITATEMLAKVFLLPLKGFFPGDGDEHGTEISGIVLQMTNMKGEFVRLGHFDIGTIRFSTQDHESCAPLFARNEIIPALQEFEDGTRKYAMPQKSVVRQEWEWRQFRITIV